MVLQKMWRGFPLQIKLIKTLSCQAQPQDVATKQGTAAVIMEPEEQDQPQAQDQPQLQQEEKNTL